MITSAINTLIYYIWLGLYYICVVVPLLFVKGIVKIYELISIGLPQYLLFGMNVNKPLSFSHLPDMFKRLAIISALVYVFLFIISVIRLGFWRGEWAETNPVSTALKFSFISMIFVVGIPLLIYLFNILISIMFSLIISTKDLAVDKQIFNSLYNPEEMSSVSFDDWQSVADNNFNFTREIYNELSHGTRSKMLFLGSLMSYATCIPLVAGLLTIVQKIFQQFYLFIISPFVASSSIADGGKRMKRWAWMYFGKSFVILGLVLSVQVFTIFLSLSEKWINTLEIDWIAKILLLFAVCVGGAFAAKGVASELGNLVGEATSLKASLNQTKKIFTTSSNVIQNMPVYKTNNFSKDRTVLNKFTNYEWAGRLKRRDILSSNIAQKHRTNTEFSQKISNVTQLNSNTGLSGVRSSILDIVSKRLNSHKVSNSNAKISSGYKNKNIF
ncbi:hypothetical protein MCAL160_0540 [Mycoplasmopsis californica HAZ160_1]|uniref:Transmembrane protein n=1 Tax=Mycoplasmopsis californica HAZ160_1 TaxID=1397850 RepID=A0AAT9F836_9BACT|nr:hypothetical protein [Mycoplasmopsis californica]BAP01080.1 hypothetical protein MCAL160_0540 [Mycoplasmopsis californica HAZ160_1]BBG40944.1 hypothetical protein MCAL106_0540 [Mycoplasmopsis californica]BBG41538.1 hypothetical protein MCAL106E_0540 [Mycoplasmopsis californica]BBG42131.1 hypothetical protein MCAL106L_0540 [Mycoplasmopsis californica]BBG42715.1 hypothetical protein MCAL160E_0540 [Mycoplasmopsis californica]